MTDTPAAGPPLRLHCTFRDAARDSAGMTKYAHFDVEAVILAPDKYGPDKRRLAPLDPDDAAWDDPVRELSGLRYTTQMDDDSALSGGGWYCGQLGFRPKYGGLADLDQARRFAKVLGRLDRATRKLEGQFGRPADEAARMAYLARALGIKDSHPFTVPLDGGDDMHGIGARPMDADQLRWWLHGQVAEWRKRYGLAAAR